MRRLNSYPVAIGLLILSFLALYWRVLHKLVVDWAYDGNYSHGFFIVPLAAFFVWERRRALAATPIRPSWVGLLVMVGSIAVLLAGLLGAELFLSRISIIGLLAGAILFVLGWGYLGKLAFPLAFLLLMIPIPTIVFNQITFPLQLLASKVAATVLPVLGVPILREGNVINLPSMALEIAEACSGIRSLMSLVTLAIIYGYLMEKRLWVRWLLALASVPIAVAANSIRIIGTGLLVQYWDVEKAEGYFHASWGWIIFVVSLVMLYALHGLVRVLFPEKGGRS